MTRGPILDERLAEALAIEEWKGAEAFDYIAGRLAELAVDNDVEGFRRFCEIADTWEALQRGTVQ